MDKVESLKLFCRVADIGSYSEVARERFTSRSGISRSISQLEKYFGVQLFKRSTRSLVLTDAGKELYIEAEKLLRQYEAMEDRIRRDRSSVKGLLRVGVPGPLSERFILPDLKLFQEKYPDIQLFFQVSESLSDLYRDELDLVIRMGALQDSGLMAVKLSDLSFELVASPSFLENHNIDEPAKLKEVDCLCFRGRGRGTNWSLTRNNEKVNLSVSGSFAANCGYTLRSMAVNGHGVIGMPRPLIKEEIESKKLVRIFEDWQLSVNFESWGIHLLYHADRHQLNRVRAFIDFMKEPNRLIISANILN